MTILDVDSEQLEELHGKHDDLMMKTRKAFEKDVAVLKAEKLKLEDEIAFLNKFDIGKEAKRFKEKFENENDAMKFANKFENGEGAFSFVSNFTNGTTAIQLLSACGGQKEAAVAFVKMTGIVDLCVTLLFHQRSSQHIIL